MLDEISGDGVFFKIALKVKDGIPKFL